MRRSTRVSISTNPSRDVRAVARERQASLSRYSDKSAADVKKSKNQGIDVKKSKISGPRRHLGRTSRRPPLWGIRRNHKTSPDHLSPSGLPGLLPGRVVMVLLRGRCHFHWRWRIPPQPQMGKSKKQGTVVVGVFGADQDNISPGKAALLPLDGDDTMAGVDVENLKNQHLSKLKNQGTVAEH